MLQVKWKVRQPPESHESCIIHPKRLQDEEVGHVDQVERELAGKIRNAVP